MSEEPFVSVGFASREDAALEAVKPKRAKSVGSASDAGISGRRSNSPDDDDDPITRQMIDKRQCRRANREAFTIALDEWRQSQSRAPTPKEAPGKGKVRSPLGANGARLPRQKVSGRRGSLLARQQGVRVIARKRPLFEHEVARGDFDVVSAGGGRLVVHNASMHPDLKRMFLKHHEFHGVDAYGEGASTEELCEGSVRPLVDNVAAGGSATLFMYGQTGSGKTYTMAGIERYAAAALLPSKKGVGMSTSEPPTLTFFELAGSRCIDLLGATRGRELNLKMDAAGAVQPVGAVAEQIHSASQLVDILAQAKGRRATHATGANAESSRSHAVAKLTLPGKGPRGKPAVLTLVDCAGSERKEDSAHHTAERRNEACAINSSLHALKECIRYWSLSLAGEKVHIPFRLSSLTRVLATSFTSQNSLLAVVGAVSPSSTDTEHSVSTLKTICGLGGLEAATREVKQDVAPLAAAPIPAAQVPPKQWDADRVRQFIKTSQEGRFAGVLPKVPAGLDGKALMKVPMQQMKTRWGADDATAKALFRAIRDANKVADAATQQRRKSTVQARRRSMYN